MQFEGSLADLSAVDVLQALRVAQKSGSLVLRGRAGEAAISLHRGKVVGCRHPRPGIDIGHLLVEDGAVSEADVAEALRVQTEAGPERKPLVGVLVEMGRLDREAGWKALERLVELTVAEVSGWTTGRFAFELGESTAPDGFCHVPAAAGPELATDTQGMVTEALRILDQRNAPGQPDGKGVPVAEMAGADMETAMVTTSAPAMKLLVFCQDGLIKTSLRAMAPGVDLDVFASEIGQDVLAQFAIWRQQGHLPVLAVDLSSGGSDPRWPRTSRALVRHARGLCAELSVIALTESRSGAFSEAFQLGACSVVPRPERREDAGGYVVQVRQCCTVLLDAVHAAFERRAALAPGLQQDRREMRLLREHVSEIRSPHGPCDVSLVVLKYVAALVDRCVLFLVREHDLLGLGGFGADDDGQAVCAAMSGAAIPLEPGSLFAAAVRTGALHHGHASDPGLAAGLHARIGAPASPEIVLVPLRARDRTAALIYGDFGRRRARALDTDALEILAEFAGMAFDLALRGRDPVARRTPVAVAVAG